ncbi:MAG TPA: TRAP transporter small permease subunit [Xanthomonadales bacterium]|nr:TRAP transporter small permease subunit [Xanthomonadales bacterium]
MEDQGVEVNRVVSRLATFQRLVANVVSGIGRGVSWLLLALVVMIFSVVVLRYGFNLGWVWLQELTVYLHSAVFLLAIAWAFQLDEHVRVDIFYRGKSPRHQAWVNLLGTALLVVPFSVYLFLMGWDYVAASWLVMEGSREAGGLNFVYLLKSLMLLLPVLLLLQACDTIPRCIAVIRKNQDDLSLKGA